MSLEIAEHSKQLFTTRQPIRVLKKSVTSVFCHWSLLRPLAPVEQSIHFLIGAEQQLLLYHTINSKLGHCYLKTINLNLGRRCGQTEIVCHWSLLMSLELAEQSIQLLTCHKSRWRLCHRSPQDNQSKSWKKVWPLFFFCHWSLLMPFAPAEQSIHLLKGAEQQLVLYHTIN